MIFILPYSEDLSFLNEMSSLEKFKNTSSSLLGKNIVIFKKSENLGNKLLSLLLIKDLWYYCKVLFVRLLISHSIKVIHDLFHSLTFLVSFSQFINPWDLLFRCLRFTLLFLSSANSIGWLSIGLQLWFLHWCLWL